MTVTFLDNLVEIFNEVSGSRLAEYLRAKGWEKPKQVVLLCDLPTVRGLIDHTTKAPAGKRDEALLTLIARLPFREDVLLGDELDDQLAIVEAHRTKQPNEAARFAAEKLFRHYTATLDPENAYRYYQLTRAQSGQPDEYWTREVLALAALLDDETRTKLDRERDRTRAL